MTEEVDSAGDMDHSQIDCPRLFRSASGDMRCGFVPEFIGLPMGSAPSVDEGTCRACLASLTNPERTNPVQASLIHQRLSEIIGSGGVGSCSLERARHLQLQIQDQLATIVTGNAERLFPPSRASGSASATDLLPGNPVSATDADGVNRWAVGMLTAPRVRPTIGLTATSLDRAGFREIHLFAEPDSPIPEPARWASVTVNRRRLGNITNFLCGLATLYEADPAADCYAMFQDDILAAEDLRTWCEQEFWPGNHGLISLFTPRIHSSQQRGWKVEQPGAKRIHGGQALAFRRDVLEQFLSDELVASHLSRKKAYDDVVVSEWASRCNLGIAYHTPSLVQHIGYSSSIFADGPDPLNSADFVSRASDIPFWSAPPRKSGKIVLVGRDSDSGLGHVNRDLARHLPVNRWLAPRTSATSFGRQLQGPTHLISAGTSRPHLKHLIEGMDWLLFAEAPEIPDVISAAREAGLRIACIPMWERLPTETPWLQFVDLMICPTQVSTAHFADWKERYALGYEIMSISWPIDVSRFQFRHRQNCRRFLFINGFGGDHGRRLDGSRLAGGRKGLDVVIEAARLVPDAPIDVFSQVPVSERTPANLHVHGAAPSNEHLYRTGDICVQPSRWEGVGLQLLECQASGLPLITTDAEPMNEYEPLRRIRLRGRHPVLLGGGQPVLCHEPCPEHLAAQMRDCLERDISAASWRAREYIEKHHNWEQARNRLRDVFAVA